MYRRLALAGLLALGVALTLLAQAVGEVATAEQSPFGAPPPPPLDTRPRAPVPCTADQPWTRHHFGFTAGQPTTGVISMDLSKFSHDPRPPLRCEQPQSDAAILADAQVHLAKLQAAIAAGDAEYRGTQGPKLYGPLTFRDGELLELVPEFLATWGLADDGSDILMILDCHCDTSVVGVPLHYADYLVLRYARMTPGASYMTAPDSVGMQRLTGDPSIPARVAIPVDDNLRRRLLEQRAWRQQRAAGLVPTAAPMPTSIPPPPGFR